MKYVYLAFIIRKRSKVMSLTYFSVLDLRSKFCVSLTKKKLRTCADMLAKILKLNVNQEAQYLPCSS